MTHFLFRFTKVTLIKLEEDLEAMGMFSKRRKRKIQQPKPVHTIENKIKNYEDIRKNK